MLHLGDFFPPPPPPGATTAQRHRADNKWCIYDGKVRYTFPLLFLSSQVLPVSAVETMKLDEMFPSVERVGRFHLVRSYWPTSARKKSEAIEFSPDASSALLEPALWLGS